MTEDIDKLRLAINGFGRIGRSFLRAAVQDKEFEKLIDIVAINDTTDAKTLAHLLKYDSTFGKFKGVVEVNDDGSILLVDNHEIRILSENDPSKLPWKEMNVDLVLESSGKFNDSQDAKKHIEAGAKKVVISAPAKQPDVTILMGINDNVFAPDKHNIISMGSCTTNCLAPVLKVINDKFGIESGYLTTTHAFTNDQKLLDSPHKDLRRARSATTSIIPTSTGAAKTIGQIIPALDGKIGGIALRVPVNNGSVTDMVLVLKKGVTKQELNRVLKDAAESEPLKGILGYTEDPIVSSDIVGESFSSIVDGLSTMVLGEKMNNVKILSWYDNEWGFAARLVDLIKFIFQKMLDAKRKLLLAE